jgi:hypothetical protein
MFIPYGGDGKDIEFTLMMLIHTLEYMVFTNSKWLSTLIYLENLHKNY